MDELQEQGEALSLQNKRLRRGSDPLVQFSDDGTMAYAVGKYSASWADAKGRTIRDEGKYLNVLKRVDGQWKVVIDAFSSNEAPAND